MDNSDWIEDEDVADPDVLPNLNGYHILVRPMSVKKKTKTGIILPDRTVDDISYLTTVGKVLSVGDVAYRDEKKFPNGPWCKVGDYVCYGKHTGIKMKYKGIKLILMYDDQVMMTVDDPSDLDTSFNLSNG
jgi:co-chaperonin GroES (HSP10)